MEIPQSDLAELTFGAPLMDNPVGYYIAAHTKALKCVVQTREEDDGVSLWHWRCREEEPGGLRAPDLALPDRLDKQFEAVYERLTADHRRWHG